MRFTTEFQCDDASWDATHMVFQHRKACYEEAMGNLIANSFGWQNPVNGNNLQHRLEIEAFPMEKWIEFKEKLNNGLPNFDTTTRIRILNALKELESFGKPAGAVKELKNDHL